MISDFKGLLAITDPESGMGRYHSGIDSTNPVTLHAVDTSELPVWTHLEVVATWGSHKGGTVCLNLVAGILSGKEQCFSSLGATLEMAGGAYTLTRLGGKNDYTIRIDKAMDARDIVPGAQR